MTDALVYLVSSFWLGAVHAATPGHGKTIAAAYIVGARGRPVDAWILGIFVTLSHTSGIVLVGVLASFGLPGMGAGRIETMLALATGALIILIGLWSLWTQRQLIPVALGTQSQPGGSAGRYTPLAQAADGYGHGHVHPHPPDHGHAHDHGHASEHGHAHGDHAHPPGGEHVHDEGQGRHSHGWGFKHTHDLKLVTDSKRPGLWMLLLLGVAGGLLPDPAALGILLNALAQGKVMLGLGTVIVFSLGFAAVLVLVGVVAAKVGRRILDWLAGPWAARLQILTSLIIMLVGVVLSLKAWGMLQNFA